MSATPVSMKQFIKVAGACARGYLAMNGPITRLEERITLAGQSLGLTCDVYATPTAVFVTAKDGNEVVTTLERSTEISVNFTDLLFYDRILDELSQGRMTIAAAEEKLSRFQSKSYSFFAVAIASFVIGFTASYPRYGHLVGAFASGLITALIYVLQRPLATKLNLSGVFTDFIGCLLAYILAVATGVFTGVGLPPVIIGALILIVPGLTLTSAVSELADHNFVSGTVKMMKSFLILVAMGVSYLLVENVLRGLEFPAQELAKVLPPEGFTQTAWFQTLCQLLMLASFCVFFHLPLRAFPGAMVAGLLSLVVLGQFENSQLYVLASFLASLSVGLMSLSLASFYSWPSQVFSTTGILALVPGLLALSSFYSLEGSPNQGEIAYRVALTAGAITFGLFTARMPFRLYNSITKGSASANRFIM